MANVATQSPQSTRKEQLESSVVRSHQVPNEQEEEVSRRSSGTGQNIDMSIDDGKPNVSVQSRRNPQLSFKLDLAKVKNDGQLNLVKQAESTNKSKATHRDSSKTGALEELQRVAKVKITPGESVRNKPNQQQLISVRKIQK